MKKLLRQKDILLLILAGAGDLIEEFKDPLRLMSSAYNNMYGFVPKRYKRNNFLQLVSRNLITGDIERIIKDGKVYLRLTSAGRNKVKRDFPITNLTKKWNKRWTLLIFDIEEKKRVVRDSLRNKLISIGFGMLQESVWITPLPIGEDTWEFIASLGLEDQVFVMDVLALRLGDPRVIARKIWHLDKFEDDYRKIKEEIEKVDQLIEKYNDRYKKSEAKLPLDLKVQISSRGKTRVETQENTSDYLSSGYWYRLKGRKKLLMRNMLEIAMSLPPLPQELLSDSFKDARAFLGNTEKSGSN